MSKPTLPKLLHEANELNIPPENCMKTKQELKKEIAVKQGKEKDTIFGNDSGICEGYWKELRDLREEEKIDDCIYWEKPARCLLCSYQSSFLFFSIWVFFCDHSRLTGKRGKGEGIYLTPLNHFHPLRSHLDISQVITVENSPLRIASSQTRTGNLWFPGASR